jgi:hypothetical protein
VERSLSTESQLGELVEGTVMRKEEKAKLVGFVELSIGSGKTATALLFDNMRWMLDFAQPSIPYEIGSTVTFVEEHGGDFVPSEQIQQKNLDRGPSVRKPH